jgi:threonyl-tRNA synthetase
VKLRDHRKLGTDLDLFSVHGEAGSGFIFWHPNLGAVRRAIEEFWWEEHTRAATSRCTRRTSRARRCSRSRVTSRTTPR